MLSHITNVETPEYDVSNIIFLWFTSEVARGAAGCPHTSPNQAWVSFLFGFDAFGDMV